MLLIRTSGIPGYARSDSRGSAWGAVFLLMEVAGGGAAAGEAVGAPDEQGGEEGEGRGGEGAQGERLGIEGAEGGEAGEMGEGFGGGDDSERNEDEADEGHAEAFAGAEEAGEEDAEEEGDHEEGGAEEEEVGRQEGIGAVGRVCLPEEAQGGEGCLEQEADGEVGAGEGEFAAHDPVFGQGEEGGEEEVVGFADGLEGLEDAEGEEVGGDEDGIAGDEDHGGGEQEEIGIGGGEEAQLLKEKIFHIWPPKREGFPRGRLCGRRGRGIGLWRG